MKRLQPHLFAVIVAGLLATTVLFVAPARAVLPKPVLAFMGQELLTRNGMTFVRYRFEVANRADFPSAMFAAAPGAAAVRQQYQFIANLGRHLRSAGQAPLRVLRLFQCG